MKCPKPECGFRNEEGDRFCTQCGTALGTDSAPAVAGDGGEGRVARNIGFHKGDVDLSRHEYADQSRQEVHIHQAPAHNGLSEAELDYEELVLTVLESGASLERVRPRLEMRRRALRLPLRVAGEIEAACLRTAAPPPIAAPARVDVLPSPAPPAQLSHPSQAREQPKSSEPGSAPKDLTLDCGKGTKLKLTLIPAGTFLMGSPDDEEDRDDDEGPQREVTLTRPFYMAVTQVTQQQYQAVIGTNPSKFKGGMNPVEQVSWDEAVEFCRMLSEKTGHEVHLPTEAQWEYACRAGTTTRFHFGDDPGYRHLGHYAWYDGNSGEKSHPVAQKKPNQWGLYDMHGNVWEWCANWYEDSYANEETVDPEGPGSGEFRVLRGGCWLSLPANCRSAIRLWILPGLRFVYIGFRVAVLAAGVD